jgi:Protein of unknown function (DUF5672)
LKPRPQLRDVTVCAADTVTPLLAARALELCLDRCDFADAILFSDTPTAGRFRHVAIDPLKSLDDYSLFCLRGMPSRVETEFALVVQWDGYVVNPDAWASSFRKYDYIGGTIYPERGPPVVGNGGFSLRSRKLLDALPTLAFVPGAGEDWIISHVFKRSLEADYGIRFAPSALAERFSYEIKPPTRPTFGFHGMPNLWRHESDAEVLRIVAGGPQSWVTSKLYFLLIVRCLDNDRTPLAGSLYAMTRREQSRAGIERLMAQWMPADRAFALVAALEETCANRRASPPPE